MCCDCCSVTQRKVWVFGLGTLFAALGITLLVIWEDAALNIMHNSVKIKPGTDGYDNWVDAPVPIYLSFYVFNWTNPEDIRNPNIKPNFVEMGPYVYLEKHHKENITFHNNDTVTYFERRTWIFDEERSNGKESDMLTAAHVITATVADEMRHTRKIVKKVINFMLNREGGHLAVRQNVSDWLFNGYQDDLIDFLKLFNTSKIDIPYNRFGFLAERNQSLEYDGSFTMYTGVEDISRLGELTHWNQRTETGYYPLPCGVVNGTTGDSFNPHLDTTKQITIFATDACRFMNLSPDSTIERFGITGTKWVATNETLDSGENYANQQCFCPDPELGDCPGTGVVECKECRDNAPIYASFPHFYLADPMYTANIEGMQPDKDKHEFYMAIDPYTGTPLDIKGRLQINMMIQPDDDYDIYRGVQKVLMPMFWFEQSMELPKDLSKKVNLAINLGDYGKYFAISLICLGGVFFIVGIVLTITKKWKRMPEDDTTVLSNN